MHECHYDYDVTSCYSAVHLTCEQLNGTLDKSEIIFAAAASELKSTLRNVIINSIKRIQVVYMSPVWENVTMTNSENGIIYAGSGAMHENDVLIKDTIVKQVIGHVTVRFETYWGVLLGLTLQWIPRL